jgi:hypothetical protein
MEHGMARTTAAGAAAKTARAKAGTAKAPAKAATKKAPAKKTAAAKPAASPTAKAAKAAAKALVKPAVKRGAKTAAKPAAKPVPKARASRSAELARPEITAQPRPVLVRDSFTMPEQEYAVLGAVKQACLKAGFEVKKSELLRAGVALLGQLDAASLRAVLGALPQLKTGRPPGE